MKSFFVIFSLSFFIICNAGAKPHDSLAVLQADNSLSNTPSDSSIHVEKRPPFYIIREIIIEGNKITHASIIQRELTFKAGDTIPSELVDEIIERCRKNIFNIQLFNFVNLKKENISFYELRLIYTVHERWYTWPSPILELADRNFNEWWFNGRDIKRVIYGMYLVQENFRGRDETVTIGVKAGFSERYSISYDIPYISKRKRGGLGIGFSFGRFHEIPYRLDSENRLMFYKDPDKYILEGIAASLRYNYRSGIYNTSIASLEFNQELVADTVTRLNPEFYVPGKNRNRYISLGFYFKHDHRDFRNYPLNGHFYDIGFRHSGLGIEGNQIQFTGFYGGVKKFWQLHTNWFYAAGLNARYVIADTLPYLFQSALGYGTDYVRGYEYNVYKGYHFGLLKTNLKYRLIPERVIKLDWFKFDKFNTIPYALYVNFIFDAGFMMVRDREPLRIANVLPGYGIGLDYVTYYNTVLRVEYTFNKFGKSDLYLHFVIPI